MSEYFWIYLIEKLDAISSFIVFFTVLSVSAAIIFIIIHFANDGEDILKRKHVKKLFWISPISLILAILIPDTNQAYKIIGIGTAVRYVNNSEQVKELPDKLVEYINIKMEEIIEEEKNETQVRN